MLAVSGCGESKDKSNAGVDPIDLEAKRLLQYFYDEQPGKPVIKYAQGDLDGDGRKDLVVIYGVGQGKNMMRVILDRKDRPTSTKEVPAPVSDQIIEFRDIDERPPLEFIVQGRKGANIGYAIFRLVNGELVDLFGEGMAGCC